MPEQDAGPSLEPTLGEWLKARAETEAHLKAAPPPGAASAQHLADLLATEESWQAQYTELLGRDTPEHRFPRSNR